MARFILFAGMLLLASLTSAQSVTFTWNANAVSADPGIKATGYKLHLGKTSGQYTLSFDAGAATTLTVTTLTPGNWFAVVGAYNAAGTESVLSNEITFALTAPTPSPTASPTPTATPSPTPTSSPSPVPTPTATPTATATPSPTPSASLVPTPSATPTPSIKFKVGSTVTPTVLVNVRSTAAGVLLGTQPAGVVATVVAGPQQALFNKIAVNWWQLSFPAAPNGWVGEDSLILYVPPSTPQTPVNLHFVSPTP